MYRDSLVISSVRLMEYIHINQYSEYAWLQVAGVSMSGGGGLILTLNGSAGMCCPQDPLLQVTFVLLWRSPISSPYSALGT